MLQSSIEPSVEKQNSLFALEVNKMTKFHLVYFMFEQAKSKVLTSESISQIKDQKLFSLLKTVLANFALKFLLHDAAVLYECGFFGAGSNALL